MKRFTQVTMEGFRIFRDLQTVDLNADIVLLYGPNGSGKTSLLHAIELNLTGSVADLNGFGDSYPLCLRHCDAKGPARVALCYVDDAGNNREETVYIQPDGRVQPQGGTLNRAERQHFLDRCYLSQARLARLLEIYQAVDSERKESPLATFVRELLGLEALENLSSGLQVIADKRRIRKDVKSYAALEDEEKELLNLESTLRSQLKTALEQLPHPSGSPSATDTIPIIPSASLLHSVTATMSDDQIESLLQELRVGLSECQQAQAVLSSLMASSPKLSAAELQSEINELASIQDRLATIMRELFNDCCEYLGEAALVVAGAPSRVLFGGEWERTQKSIEARTVQLRAALANYTQWEKDLSKARATGDELDQKWLNLSAQIQPSQNPAQKLGEALHLMLDHIDGEHCPICDRDYSEIGTGSLKEHVASKLLEVEKQHSLLASLLSLQADRDEQRRAIADMDSRDTEMQKQRASNNAALKLGIQLLERFKELSSSRDTWLRNDERSQAALSEMARAKNVAEQMTHETSRVLQIASKFDIGLDDSQSVSEHTQTVCSELGVRVSAVQEAHRLRVENKRVQASVEELRIRIKDCETALASCQSRLKRANKIIAAGRDVARKAAEQKRRVIEQVFDQTMNGLWRDLFDRLVLKEAFYPRLSPPESIRNRVSTRLSAGRGGDLAFQDLAAVMSSGNVNTAALSLFLALNLIEKARHHMLILDDPVQSMDDVHVINLANLLKSIVRQADRQVLVAVHERALFDFLRIELGPSKEGESLITLELNRPSEDYTLISSQKFGWEPDRVSFVTPSTA